MSNSKQKENRSTSCFLCLIMDYPTPIHFYCLVHIVGNNQQGTEQVHKAYSVLATTGCGSQLQNNQQLEKMHLVWIEMSLASSPEKDFLLSVIMGINDSPRKQCVLLIAHALSRLVWSSGQSEQLAGIKITETIAKTKLLWKRKFKPQRRLKVNFLNRN